MNLKRITNRIQSLAQDPRPRGSEKLSIRNLYRIRQSDYKIVYFIEDETSEI
ncbi:MAG: type II toxin-antitoxin system RelE/ParE family toxin [Candidatus Aminicenantes bacterium]|jgi:mRNA interferase RelE/StbE